MKTHRAILSNDDVLPETPLSELWLHDFWGTPLRHSGSHGSYRPLTTLSFKLNAVWAGGDLRAVSSSKGFHVVNVILHSATTAVFTWWIGLLPSSHARLTQWLSGLLFAVHPVHTEAVSGIVGRADVGAALFFLLALLAYKAHLHHRDKRSGFVQMMYLVLCLLSALCSMLTKEHGVTVLLVCVLYEMLFNTRHTPTEVLQHLLKRPCRCDQNDCQDSKKIQEWSSRCLIVSFCIFICARACLAGGHLPRFSTADNPASRSESFLTRTLTFLYLPVFNFLLLLCPTTLSFDWSMDAIPLITSIIDRRNLSILTFYCAFIVVIFRNIKCLNVNKPVIAFDTIVKRTTVDVNENNDYQVNSEWLKATNNLQDPSKLKDTQTYHSSTNQFHFKQYHRTCNLIKNNSTHLAHRRCNFNQCSCETTVQKLDTPIALKMSKKRNDSKVILMAIVLLVVPFLPATNLVAYVGFVVAERVLYISSMGHSLLVGHGLSRLIAWSVGRRIKWQQFLVMLFTAVLLVVFGSKTWIRNFDWYDEESLYRSGLDVNPPKAYGNLGNILSVQGRYTEAEMYYRGALTFRPNMADVHYNLGVLLQNQQRLQEAIYRYRVAIQCRPRLAVAHLNLGIVLSRVGRLKDSKVVLRACSMLDGTGLKDPRSHDTARVACLFHLGRLTMEEGRLREAVEIFLEAVGKMPHYYQPQSLFNMLGEACSRLGEDKEAENWFKASLATRPDHVPTHLTYGKLLARNITRVIEAENWYTKALSIAPQDVSVYRHYGQFLLDQSRYSEAASKFERAVSLSTPEYEDVVRAATSLRLAGNHREAERYYKMAVNIRPWESSGLSNLGALYHLMGRLPDAEDCYKRALKLSPADTVTRENLRRLKNIINLHEEQRRIVGS
uniref:dolichyl-phosphate-mannose--protein mannosyltransferase n=1 Tax=Timema douglasi TaxID=61478 RepID=A0A7R8VQL4_TIMDO|nr:unnamed protein product [Timema douglasi]